MKDSRRCKEMPHRARLRGRLVVPCSVLQTSASAPLRPCSRLALTGGVVVLKTYAQCPSNGPGCVIPRLARYLVVKLAEGNDISSAVEAYDPSLVLLLTIKRAARATTLVTL